MLNSLLGAVDFGSLILDIFIILAVIIAGALVIYFLWEIITSFINKNKADGAAKEPAVQTQNNVLVMDYSLEGEKEAAKEEPVQAQALIDETKLTDVDEAKAEAERKAAEEAEAERANAERRAYLEARRQELIRRMQAEMEEEKEEPAAQSEEVVEETVVEEKEEPAVDAAAEERKALEEEKARYAAMVKELEDAKNALAQQAATEPKTETITKIVEIKGTLSLEELKRRLAEAEEHLKETEKEYKQCKKEYSPLHRVWATHERDEKKLRRKEALVAKQKVILYGVNNYADIDEEKAKKLAEDLDLLDGLKLSVQHCEEVMQKNADRYPLLEKMYKVLKARDDEIRADIEYYKTEIARLEAEAEQQGLDVVSETPDDAE